jgi:hypothetical protein
MEECTDDYDYDKDNDSSFGSTRTPAAGGWVDTFSWVGPDIDFDPDKRSSFIRVAPPVASVRADHDRNFRALLSNFFFPEFLWEINFELPRSRGGAEKKSFGDCRH